MDIFVLGFDAKDAKRKMLMGRAICSDLGMWSFVDQGVVEFESEDDMRLALRKLDDTEFRNP